MTSRGEHGASLSTRDGDDGSGGYLGWTFVLYGRAMRWVLAVSVVLCSLAAPAGADAAAVAVITSSGIRVIHAGGHVVRVAGPGEWVDVAYGGDGRLYATSSTADGCDLVDPLTGATVITGAEAIARTDRTQGLCDVSSDPAGGLLFEADNGTLGSTGTFHLDLNDGSVTSAAYGYSASAAADGTLVSVQHRYFSQAGSYEQPHLVTPAGGGEGPCTRALAQGRAAVQLGRDKS